MLDSQRIKYWSAVLIVSVLSTAGLVITPSGDAAALGVPNFSLTPIAAPGTTPRGAFHYDMLPGQSIHDSVVLSNETSQFEDFQIWASDAYNTTVGGALTLRPQGYPMTGVGTWIDTHLGSGIYGLKGNTSVTINFTVTAPPNATSGTHVGGIEALNVTPTPQPKGGHAHFVIQNGIGAAVFVQVAGPTRAAAAVSDISVKSSIPAIGFGNRSAIVSFQLENTGNTLLSGHAVATVTDVFGRTVKTFSPILVRGFVPGGRFTVIEPKWSNLPLIGPQTVHVTFTSTGMNPVTGATTFWIFPWLLVLLVLLAIGLIVWRLIARRRGRAATTDPSGAGPGNSDKGSATNGEATDPPGEEREHSVATTS